MNEQTKTSKQWALDGEIRDCILDPDGWDRSSMNAFDYSFSQELITKQEFIRRIGQSTCLFSDKLLEFISTN